MCVKVTKSSSSIFCVVEDLDLSSLIKIEYLPTSQSKEGKQMSTHTKKRAKYINVFVLDKDITC